ncbi:MAG: tetratricopeptide repeat protein, partial [Promethearchaeota archaeon]
MHLLSQTKNKNIHKKKNWVDTILKKQEIIPIHSSIEQHFAKFFKSIVLPYLNENWVKFETKYLSSIQKLDKGEIDKTDISQEIDKQIQSLLVDPNFFIEEYFLLPQTLQEWMGLGRYFFEHQFLQRAKTCFEYALKIDSDFGPALLGFGLTLIYAENYTALDEFLQNYTPNLELNDKELIPFQTMVGVNHYYQKRYDRATTILSDILEIDPKNKLVRQYLNLTMLKNGQFIESSTENVQKDKNQSDNSQSDNSQSDNNQSDDNSQKSALLQTPLPKSKSLIEQAPHNIVDRDNLTELLNFMDKEMTAHPPLIENIFSELNDLGWKFLSEKQFHASYQVGEFLEHRGKYFKHEKMNYFGQDLIASSLAQNNSLEDLLKACELFQQIKKISADYCSLNIYQKTLRKLYSYLSGSPKYKHLWVELDLTVAKKDL